MLRSTLSLWHKAIEKCDVKRGSRSEMTLEGSPNHLYMLSRYNRTTPSPVTLVVHRMNNAARVHLWSTIVRMASYP
jgi:hypothetical protein